MLIILFFLKKKRNMLSYQLNLILLTSISLNVNGVLLLVLKFIALKVVKFTNLSNKYATACHLFSPI